MDASVPTGAAIILKFIGALESKMGYGVIYGNHEGGLAAPITGLSLNALLAAQAVWGKKWGSSAAGAYQFMPPTLRGLMPKLGLTGAELFTPNLQDRLAFQLLKGRGYANFMAGRTTAATFGLALAQEWASMPVLAPVAGAHRRVARGETYYAGDKLNRALAPPDKVEAMLALALAAGA